MASHANASANVIHAGMPGSFSIFKKHFSRYMINSFIPLAKMDLCIISSSIYFTVKGIFHFVTPVLFMLNLNISIYTF